MRFIKTIQSSYAQLCVIFILVVLLKELDIIPAGVINLKLFAYLLPFLSIPALLKIKKESSFEVPYANIILMTLLLFLFISRIVPYLFTNVPLGYDAGLYKYTMELYISALPDIPEHSLPEWVKSMYPQGLFILTDTLHIFTGMQPQDFLKIVFPLLCSLLVLPIYTLTKNLFDQRSAVIASTLYAFSLTQYSLFTYLYFKNIIGLILLLVALFLLEKKKYAPLTVIYASLGFYHRPEFLLFSLTLIPYYLHSKDKKIAYMTIVTAFLITPFWIPRLLDNLSLLQGVAKEAVINIQAGSSTGGGTFYSLDMYEYVSLAYIPFGLMGLFFAILRKKWNGLFYLFMINAAIVIFKLFFFKRLIISLDILLIIFAGAGLNYAFLGSGIINRKTGTIALSLLLVSSGLLLVDNIPHDNPLMDDEQQEMIEWIALNSEKDAYVLATSYDAPWVLGWSKRKVIAPGLFQWDKHNESEWREFLSTEDKEKGNNFLSVWDSQVYIFYSKNHGNKMQLQKYNSNYFILKEDNKKAAIYEYVGKKNETR